MRTVREWGNAALVAAGVGAMVLVVPAGPTVSAAVGPTITVSSTSDPSTPVTAGTVGDPVPLAIGEQVVIRMELTLAESTTISMRAALVLPAGLDVVSGSAYVSYLADTAPSMNGDFSGIQNSSTPNLAFPASRLTYDSGTRLLSFDFGSVINNDGDADAEWIELAFTAVVPNQLGVDSGDALAAGFDAMYDEGLPTEVLMSSEDLHFVVVEPALDATALYAPDSQPRGGTSTLTIDVTNLAADGATGPAHDLLVAETFDDWLHIASVDVAFNAAAATFGSTFTDNSVVTPGFAIGVEDDLSVAISGLPVDGSASIVVTLQSDATTAVGSLPRTISTTVDASGDSLSSATSPVGDQRSYSTTASDDLTVFRTPIPTVTSVAGSPTNAGSIPFVVAFDEDVTGFDAGDISLTAPAGATIADFIAVTARAYTVDISGMTADGDVTVAVTAGAATNSDGRPNAASAPVTVVYDTTAPTFTGPAEGSTVEATTDAGQSGTEVEFSVDAENVECIPASGSFFEIGTTEVECTAEDDAGNTAVLSFSVEVTDDELPTIGDNPDIEVQLPRGSTTTVVTYALPPAGDNSGTVDVGCGIPSGSSLPAGVYVVTCTATDPSGNDATSSFTITVLPARSIPATGGDPWAALRLAVVLVTGGAAMVAVGTLRRRRRTA